MKSKFVSRLSLKSRALTQFERWLSRQKFSPCDRDYPMAVHAAELVEDFIYSNQEWSDDREDLELHADKIGYMSDYAPNR